MMKETLISVCSLLNRYEVEYVVIGGVAVIFHGYLRTTADLVFWYKPTIANFHKIVSAFKEYGIDVSTLEEAVFDPQKTFLRFPTAGFRTEFLPYIAGDLTFSDAKKRAVDIELEGVKVPVLGYDDLIKSKTFTNRLRDLADIEELTKRKKGRG